MPTPTTAFKGTVLDVPHCPPRRSLATSTWTRATGTFTWPPRPARLDVVRHRPLSGNTLPAPATNGQVLQVSGGQVAWQGPVDEVMPDGGAPGQIVSKVDGTNGNVHWIDPPISLPAGGSRADAEQGHRGSGGARWVGQSRGRRPSPSRPPLVDSPRRPAPRWSRRPLPLTGYRPLRTASWVWRGSNPIHSPIEFAPGLHGRRRSARPS